MYDFSEMAGTLEPFARKAGHAIMSVYNKDVRVQTKGDGSPVTLADKKAEAIISDGLAKHYPQIPVVSEENAASHSLKPAEAFFLVDPLDGTKEFLKRDGKGAFTVNIAFIENRIPTMGIVYAPALDQMFSGSVQHGASENGKQIHARSAPSTGMVAVASETHRDSETNKWLEEHQIQHTISIGSSIKFCLLAKGDADIYPRFSPTMEWDTAAGDAILRAAGGNVENPNGSVFMYGKPEYRNGAFIAKGRI